MPECRYEIIPFDSRHQSWAAELHQETMDEPWSQASFEETLQHPGAWGFVALSTNDNNSRALGFIIGRTITKEAEVLTIVTHPDHQNQGVGRALMNQAMNGCLATGVHAFFLEVSMVNDSALHLYQSLGFEIVGERPNYYRKKKLGAHKAFILRKKV